MSKSKGNVVTPTEYFSQFSADAMRYWAASARLGTDTTFDEAVLKSGKRLTLKIFNAAKFVDFIGPDSGEISEELDRAFLHSLKTIVMRATDQLANFEFAKAFQTIEDFFWNGFTDTYIELSKNRAKEDGRGQRSARTALNTALSILLRLFAPYLPYVTEECWSWWLSKTTGELSIHKAPWPSAEEFAAITSPQYDDTFIVAQKALSAIHKAKTLAGKSVGMPVKTMSLVIPANAQKSVNAIMGDLKGAGRAAEITTALGSDEFEVADIQFAE